MLQIFILRNCVLYRQIAGWQKYATFAKNGYYSTLLRYKKENGGFRMILLLFVDGRFVCKMQLIPIHTYCV